VALKKVRMDNEKEGVGSAFCHVKELFKKKKKKKKKKVSNHCHSRNQDFEGSEPSKRDQSDRGCDEQIGQNGRERNIDLHGV
jgi:hypothetical protein